MSQARQSVKAAAGAQGAVAGGGRNTLAERTFVEEIDEEDRFVASPSILELPSGRLLVLLEK